MGFQHAYSTTNLYASVSSVLSWSSGDSTNLAFLDDGRMDQVFNCSAQSGGITLFTFFSVAQAVNAIALLNHNLSAATSPTVAVSYSDDGTTYFSAKSATTPNTQFPRARELVLQFPQSTHQYWKVVFTWTGSFALTLGEVYAALTVQPARYVVYGGHSETILPQVEQFQGYTGEIRTVAKGVGLRQKELTWSDLSTADRDSDLSLLNATQSGAVPILWCEQYDNGSASATNDQQDVIFGILQMDGGWTWTEFDFQRYNLNKFIIRSKARDVGH